MTFEFVPDENVETLGKRLMHVRQEKELSLADVANDIKIHEKYLVAIEEGDDTLFPDRVFKELFVKAYAEYLGLSLDDLLTRLPDAPDSSSDPSRPTPKAGRSSDAAGRATPFADYRSEEVRRTGGRSFLVVGLVVVIVVLGFFLIKLTFERPSAKVVIPEAIPKSVAKKPTAPDSAAMVADTTGSGIVSDSLGVATITADSTAADSAVADSTEVVPPPDSVLLLMVGKGRCWLRVLRDADTAAYEGTVRVNDTLWFGMQDSIYLKLGRGNAVDLYLNALPLKIAEGDDTSVVSLWISRDNYLKYVDSSRLVP